MKSSQFAFASACSVFAVWGCASQPKNNPDASYAEIKHAELSHERQEFIADTREELQQVDNDLAQTRAKLEHESQYVTAEQRAEWTQEIFELRQEHQRLSAELQRAETANEAEWKEMRGPLAVGVDSLQAAATKVGTTISGAFDDEAAASSREGLCVLKVGKTEAKVEGQSRTVVVDVTTDPASVPQLRTKAAELARTTTRYGVSAEPRPNQGDVPNASSGIPVAMATQNIEAGVRMTFTPNESQLDALEQRLEQDAKLLKEDRCTSEDPARVSVK